MAKLKSAEILAKNPSALQCRCCGLYVDKGLIKHLTKLHGLTVAAYKEKYGDDAPIVSSETSKKLSENTKGEKNAWFNHGGRLSRFSKNHVKYAGLSEEEAQSQISEFASACERDVTKATNRIEHYLAKGLNEEEARLALSERQRTFSLEKCIQRHGEEEGRKRWQERQEKWHKSYKKTNYSRISQTLFKQLTDIAPNAIFAECVMNDCNNEYVFKTKRGSVFKLDFYDESSGKIIEFDGTYWHEHRQLSGINKTRDAERDAAILDTDSRLQILHVKESEYRKDPEGTIEKCKKFLSS